jgi:hypothetical protein
LYFSSHLTPDIEIPLFNEPKQTLIAYRRFQTDNKVCKQVSCKKAYQLVPSRDGTRLDNQSGELFHV